MTKLNCVRCFRDSLGVIKQYTAFHLWHYVGGIIINSLLSTHDKFGPPVQDNIFICHKCGSRTLKCIIKHLHAIFICKRLNLFRFLAQPGIQHVTNSALVIEMLI